MVKLQEANGKYTVTIPKEFVKSKGWKKGEILVLGFDSNGDLVLREVKKK